MFGRLESVTQAAEVFSWADAVGQVKPQSDGSGQTFMTGPPSRYRPPVSESSLTRS